MTSYSIDPIREKGKEGQRLWNRGQPHPKTETLRMSQRATKPVHTEERVATMKLRK